MCYIPSPVTQTQETRNAVIQRNDNNEDPFQHVLLHRLVGVFTIQPRHDKTNSVAMRPGADTGFLERGFMLKGVGVRFAYFISFFLNIL